MHSDGRQGLLGLSRGGAGGDLLCCHPPSQFRLTETQVPARVCPEANGCELAGADGFADRGGPIASNGQGLFQCKVGLKGGSVQGASRRQSRRKSRVLPSLALLRPGQPGAGPWARKPLVGAWIALLCHSATHSVNTTSTVATKNVIHLLARLSQRLDFVGFYPRVEG